MSVPFADLEIEIVLTVTNNLRRYRWSDVGLRKKLRGEQRNAGKKSESKWSHLYI
jgi:hypothetical protein